MQPCLHAKVEHKQALHLKRSVGEDVGITADGGREVGVKWLWQDGRCHWRISTHANCKFTRVIKRAGMLARIVF